MTNSEIEDPDHSSIDEIDERLEALASHLVAWELHDQIADRAHRLGFVRHRCSHLRRSDGTRPSSHTFAIPSTCLARTGGRSGRYCETKGEQLSEEFEDAVAAEPPEGTGNQKLAVLLAMAMFVLVVDTSLMNVSISSVVRDLDTTVSGVQSAIALEALICAFILISSKIGDLIGRKKAYVLGLSATPSAPSR